MEHLLFFLFLLVSSFLFAKIEVEIEGARGWAQDLPTRKFPREHFLSRYVFGGRPATMYHVFALMFIAVMAHIPYMFVSPSLAYESRTLSFIVLFWCLEDFLWFTVNPSFGLRRFRKENIWWHERQWWGIAPRDYFIFIPLGIIAYALSIVL